MPDPALDLSHAESWHGLRPGMLRTQSVAVLRGGGAKFEDDANDPCWLEIPEWGMELRFTTGESEDGSQTLRQIVLSDPACHWSGVPLIGQPLATVFKTMGTIVEGCAWRAEHPENDIDGPAEAGGTFAEESLLGSGTLWMRRRPLGLALQNGEVKEIAWRREEDAPRSFAGTFTPAQWAICERLDATEYLRMWSPVRKRMSAPEFLLTGVFALSLIGIAVHAFQEQQHWQSAPKANARVTALAPIRVEFADGDGKVQSAALEPADFYVAPTTIGQIVDVSYLPMDPIRVKGPARVRDAGFLGDVPWAIGAAALYVAAMAGVRWVARANAERRERS